MANMKATACCGACGSTERLHRHHVDWHHGNNRADNVMLLCERCHVEAHRDGYITREELAAMRRRREANHPEWFEGETDQRRLF